MGIISNNLKKNFGPDIFKNISISCTDSPPFFYMEAKFGTLEKNDKKKQLTSIEIKFFRRTNCTPFLDNERDEEI
jgi:hypothetical protein